MRDPIYDSIFAQYLKYYCPLSVIIFIVGINSVKCEFHTLILASATQFREINTWWIDLEEYLFVRWSAIVTKWKSEYWWASLHTTFFCILTFKLEVVWSEEIVHLPTNNVLKSCHFMRKPMSPVLERIMSNADTFLSSNWARAKENCSSQW